MKSLAGTIFIFLAIITVSILRSNQSFADTKDCKLVAIKPATANTKSKIEKTTSLVISTPESTENGKLLFLKNNCISCHSIQGRGGCLAPPLDGIGKYRSKNFIESRITSDTRAVARFKKLYPYSELLEHPRLPAIEAREMTAYLLTLSEPVHGFKISGHTIHSEGKTTEAIVADCRKDRVPKVNEGRLILYDRNCLSCHSIRNMGGHFAPEFDGISKRRDRTFISEHINKAEFFALTDDSEYNERGTMMPPSDLTKEQIESITDYLMSLP